uniref:Histidine kinase n=1 Tax=Thermosporothrix sp. COM3 TaxID=2490863 RepID=A0A455SLB9_9CHLR|nr:histidine kinase [Thermosporothrix sp. COM3]
MIKGTTPYKHTLVATLGGNPQIVTCTLDLLLRQGIPIYEVIVVHPAASPRIRQSLKRLNAEFVGDHYTFEGQIRTIHFRQQVLAHYNTLIDDMVDDQTVNGALDTIGELIRSLKQQQRIIYFSISGGRRLMSFLAFSTALLYFDAHDKLLHLYTPEHIKEQADKEGSMHSTPDDGRRLIEVPFTRASQSLLATMSHLSSSGTIMTQQIQQIREAHWRCKQVVDNLSERARDVLRAYAQGLSPAEVAKKLCITESTVSFHTTRIYDECRNVWNLPASKRLTYFFLQKEFADYFAEH